MFSCSTSLLKLKGNLGVFCPVLKYYINIKVVSAHFQHKSF